MKNRLIWGLVAGLVLMMGISTGASAENTATDRPGFTAADNEFYLTDSLYFFFRPGLELTIIDYEIPDDLQPLVTFTVTDAAGGWPLDMYGIMTPGPVDPRFFISYIPEGEENLVNYITGSRGPTYDRDGTFETIELGTYTYKYANALPEDYDQGATHYIAAAARRDLRDFDLDRYASNDVVTFVPDGSADPMPRDVVTTDTCNRCHDPLAEHGSRYQEVAVCEQCHNPALVDDGVSYSLNVLAHRVHMELGSEFPPAINDCQVCHTGGTPTGDYPLVANPNPASACNADGLSMTEIFWGDVGSVQIKLDSADGSLFASSGGAGSQATGQWVNDGQTFVMVDGSGAVISEVDVNNTVFGCANNAPGTFRGAAGEQHDRWMTRPSRDVCGSCHSNIDFETGEGHLAQTDDTRCAQCHQPMGSEFGRSVAGAHTVPYKSNQLDGVLVEIIDIINTGPGQRPIVTFSLSTKAGPLNPADMNRLLFSLSGPNDDFSFYAQDSALGNLISAEPNWKFQFTSKLPTDAMGSYSLGVEGRVSTTLNTGQDNEISISDQMQNFIDPFAVTDTSPVSRRMIVDDETCENCHSNLSLHGSNRHDAGGYCQTCHMPGATDEEVRLEGNNESIHFKYMIHKLHMGSELENGYVVYGYRSSVHDYSHVEYVGDLRNCEGCHEEGTYNLPIADGALPTVSPNTQITEMLPETAACLSCHDGDSAAAHADANTGSLGESCATCHGEGKTYSVLRVHAR